MLKRRLKLLAKVLLGFILLGLVFLLIERWRGQIALASFKKELRAQGEKLLPADFTRTFRAEDNGAPAAIAAIERLTNGTVLPSSRPPLMQLMPSGRAVIGFRESAWVEPGAYRNDEWIKGPITNTWADVASDVQINAPLLVEVRAAMAYPVLNNQVRLDFSNPLQLQFQHLYRIKAAASWFGANAQLMLREGRLPDARDNLLQEIGLLRLLAEDQLAISELVRIAVAAIARAHTWEAVQAPGWTDADLAALQVAWSQQSFRSNMVQALEGELVFVSSSIRAMRNSNDATFDMRFGPFASFFGEDQDDPGCVKMLEGLPGGETLLEFGRRQIYCRLWRFAWSHQAELRSMRSITELVDLARRATSDTSYQVIESDLSALLLRVADKGPYDRLRFPPSESVVSLSKTIEKATRAEIDRSLTITAIALQRYSLRHGKYPVNLDALVPEFIASIPIDYMDGKPIKYRLNADGSFTLYSVGQDGKDDGGDLTQSEGTRAKDLWYRRDYVWPAPATPEEVEAYRQETNRN